MTEWLHFHFYTLEKEMATHSSVLAWRIPGTGEPAGLPSMGSHRVRHDWSNLAAAAAAALYLYIALGSIASLPILILLIQSIGYFSISLNHLQFPLPMFYSFQHASLSSPRSCLFLGYFFKHNFKWLWFFSIAFSFWYLLVSVKKGNRFLYINLVSYYLAEFIYPF